jgi:hypothetical protein
LITRLSCFTCISASTIRLDASRRVTSCDALNLVLPFSRFFPGSPEGALEPPPPSLLEPPPAASAAGGGGRQERCCWYWYNRTHCCCP